MRHGRKLAHAGCQARRVASEPGGLSSTKHRNNLLQFAEAFSLNCVFLQLLASASYDNNICIYKEEDDDWECRATLTGHASTVWSVSFDAAGRRLASCSDDRTVKIWREYPSEGGQGENSSFSSTKVTVLEVLDFCRLYDEYMNIISVERRAVVIKGWKKILIHLSVMMLHAAILKKKKRVVAMGQCCI